QTGGLGRCGNLRQLEKRRNANHGVLWREPELPLNVAPKRFQNFSRKFLGPALRIGATETKSMGGSQESFELAVGIFGIGLESTSCALPNCHVTPSIDPNDARHRNSSVSISDRRDGLSIEYGSRRVCRAEVDTQVDRFHSPHSDLQKFYYSRLFRFGLER